MAWTDGLGALLFVGAFAYLIVALLKPERFQ